MLISKNNIIAGKCGKPILLDYGYKEDGIKKPLIIFAHGFKGFKDWGHFNRVMEYFIEHDFAFVKFNFSHNGGTMDDPIDFPDLEAFGNNNYSKELSDLRSVVDWVSAMDVVEVDHQAIYLLGHSRGGGISVIAAYEDQRIKKLVTLAAVSDLVNRFPEHQLAQWKEDGVIYIENSRTKQQMPMYYQMVEDALKQKDRFDVEKAANQLTIPHLIIHGSDDQVVLLKEAEQMSSWNASSELLVVEGGDHTFGASHPFQEVKLPKDVVLVLQETLAFFKNNFPIGC